MKRPTLLTAIVWALACVPAAAGTIVNFKVSGLSFDVELFDDEAPGTVANFLSYVNAGAYDGSIFHRSTTYDPGEVQIIQGGAFAWNANDELDVIPTNAPIVNEPGLDNLRGTIAMAKTSDPDSATSSWFFNVTDNPNLDLITNSGGFTVFGQVIGANGLASIDAIAGLNVYGQYDQNAPAPLAEAPLIASGNELYYVTVQSVAVVPEPSTLALAALGIAATCLTRRRK